MTAQAPTVGRIVHYTLNEADADAIGRQRLAAGNTPGTFNIARVGDVYPALVVRVFDPTVSTANLQVLLDGVDSYWATSRTEGEGPGFWSWPPRA